MRRRTALNILTGSGIFSGLPATGQNAHGSHTTTKPQQDDELLFFSDQENALLDRLAEMIIPADSRSGGAHNAKVSRQIDRTVAYSGIERQDAWRASLKAVDADAQRRFHRSFLECDAASQDTLMAEWARNERTPKTELEKFFVQLKQATAAAYYNSPIGVLQELGYRGNTAVGDFPGCNQPCKFCGS